MLFLIPRLDNLCEDIADDGFIKVRESNYEKYQHVFEGKTNKNKKRKAKREKHFDDYYEFRSNGQKVREAEESLSGEEDDLDEGRLADEEYLNKRKEILRKQFQKIKKKVKSN